jgi:hypothetical protein
MVYHTPVQKQYYHLPNLSLIFLVDHFYNEKIQRFPYCSNAIMASDICRNMIAISVLAGL